MDKFINENLGNIWEDESIDDVLYKMNEHLSHIIVPLGEFQRNEEVLQSYVR